MTFSPLIRDSPPWESAGAGPDGSSTAAEASAWPFCRRAAGTGAMWPVEGVVAEGAAPSMVALRIAPGGVVEEEAAPSMLVLWSAQGGVRVGVRSRASREPGWSTSVAHRDVWLESFCVAQLAGKGGVCHSSCDEAGWRYLFQHRAHPCAPRPGRPSTQGCQNRGCFSGGHTPEPAARRCAASRQYVTRGGSPRLQGGGGAALSGGCWFQRGGILSRDWLGSGLGGARSNPPRLNDRSRASSCLLGSHGVCLLGRRHPDERKLASHMWLTTSP
jgi:hypothetical protein